MIVRLKSYCQKIMNWSSGRRGPMSQRVELEEVNKRIRDMYEKYNEALSNNNYDCLLYTSPSPRDRG